MSCIPPRNHEVNFLADESVDRPIVERLRRHGHHVLFVAEMEPGLPDEAVLKRARDESAVLVTADKDFGELVFRQKLLAHGVMLLRLVGLTSEAKAELVAFQVERRAAEMAEAFTVISPGRIRVRKTRQ